MTHSGRITSFDFSNVLLTSRWLLALVLCVISAPGLAADDDEERKLPDPEDITLETIDKVVIKATYWEPKEPSKSTVPVILLHGWEGQRKEFDVVGRVLQEQFEHAVISIDLRGHGGSTKQRDPAADKDREIDPKRMAKRDFEAMIADVHAAKAFLLKKHKLGELNIELLTIVGADMGAIVAMRYAVFDWNQPRVAARLFKRGQDVRGLVLLSPPRTFKGMTSDVFLKHPITKSSLSTMIIVGAKERKAFADAKSLHGALSKFHVKVDDDAPASEKEDKMDLFLMETPTTLQGTKLLAGALKTDLMISKFIELRLVKKSDDVPWMDRN